MFKFDQILVELLFYDSNSWLFPLKNKQTNKQTNLLILFKKQMHFNLDRHFPCCHHHLENMNTINKYYY